MRSVKISVRILSDNMERLKGLYPNCRTSDIINRLIEYRLSDNKEKVSDNEIPPEVMAIIVGQYNKKGKLYESVQAKLVDKR